jgi:hypothetical protein
MPLSKSPEKSLGGWFKSSAAWHAAVHQRNLQAVTWTPHYNLQKSPKTDTLSRPEIGLHKKCKNE